MTFNEELAYLKLKLYDSSSIPQIKEDIPESITRITYDVNLANVEDIDFNVLKEII